MVRRVCVYVCACACVGFKNKFDPVAVLIYSVVNLMHCRRLQCTEMFALVPCMINTAHSTHHLL